MHCGTQSPIDLSYRRCRLRCGCGWSCSCCFCCWCRHCRRCCFCCCCWCCCGCGCSCACGCSCSWGSLPPPRGTPKLLIATVERRQEVLQDWLWWTAQCTDPQIWIVGFHWLSTSKLLRSGCLKSIISQIHGMSYKDTPRRFHQLFEQITLQPECMMLCCSLVQAGSSLFITG